MSLETADSERIDPRGKKLQRKAKKKAERQFRHQRRQSAQPQEDWVLSSLLTDDESPDQPRSVKKFGRWHPCPDEPALTSRLVDSPIDPPKNVNPLHVRSCLTKEERLELINLIGKKDASLKMNLLAVYRIHIAYPQELQSCGISFDHLLITVQNRMHDPRSLRWILRVMREIAYAVKWSEIICFQAGALLFRPGKRAFFFSEVLAIEKELQNNDDRIPRADSLLQLIAEWPPQPVMTVDLLGKSCLAVRFLLDPRPLKVPTFDSLLRDLKRCVRALSITRDICWFCSGLKFVPVDRVVVDPTRRDFSRIWSLMESLAHDVHVAFEVLWQADCWQLPTDEDREAFKDHFLLACEVRRLLRHVYTAAPEFLIGTAYTQAWNQPDVHLVPFGRYYYQGESFPPEVRANGRPKTTRRNWQMFLQSPHLSTPADDRRAPPSDWDLINLTDRFLAEEIQEYEEGLVSMLADNLTRLYHSGVWNVDDLLLWIRRNFEDMTPFYRWRVFDCQSLVPGDCSPYVKTLHAGIYSLEQLVRSSGDSSPDEQWSTLYKELENLCRIGFMTPYQIYAFNTAMRHEGPQPWPDTRTDENDRPSFNLTDIKRFDSILVEALKKRVADMRKLECLINRYVDADEIGLASIIEKPGDEDQDTDTGGSKQQRTPTTPTLTTTMTKEDLIHHILTKTYRQDVESDLREELHEWYSAHTAEAAGRDIARLSRSFERRANQEIECLKAAHTESLKKMNEARATLGDDVVLRNSEDEIWRWWLEWYNARTSNPGPQRSRSEQLVRGRLPGDSARRINFWFDRYQNEANEWTQQIEHARALIKRFDDEGCTRKPALPAPVKAQDPARVFRMVEKIWYDIADPVMFRYELEVKLIIRYLAVTWLEREPSLAPVSSASPTDVIIPKPNSRSFVSDQPSTRRGRDVVDPDLYPASNGQEWLAQRGVEMVELRQACAGSYEDFVTALHAHSCLPGTEAFPHSLPWNPNDNYFERAPDYRLQKDWCSFFVIMAEENALNKTLIPLARRRKAVESGVNSLLDDYIVQALYLLREHLRSTAHVQKLVYDQHFQRAGGYSRDNELRTRGSLIRDARSRILVDPAAFSRNGFSWGYDSRKSVQINEDFIYVWTSDSLGKDYRCSTASSIRFMINFLQEQVIWHSQVSKTDPALHASLTYLASPEGIADRLRTTTDHLFKELDPPPATPPPRVTPPTSKFEGIGSGTGSRYGRPVGAAPFGLTTRHWQRQIIKFLGHFSQVFEPTSLAPAQIGLLQWSKLDFFQLRHEWLMRRLELRCKCQLAMTFVQHLSDILLTSTRTSPVASADGDDKDRLHPTDLLVELRTFALWAAADQMKGSDLADSCVSVLREDRPSAPTSILQKDYNSWLATRSQRSKFKLRNYNYIVGFAYALAEITSKNSFRSREADKPKHVRQFPQSLVHPISIQYTWLSTAANEGKPLDVLEFLQGSFNAQSRVAHNYFSTGLAWKQAHIFYDFLRLNRPKLSSMGSLSSSDQIVRQLKQQVDLICAELIGTKTDFTILTSLILNQFVWNSAKAYEHTSSRGSGCDESVTHIQECVRDIVYQIEREQETHLGCGIEQVTVLCERALAALSGTVTTAEELFPRYPQAPLRPEEFHPFIGPLPANPAEYDSIIM